MNITDRTLIIFVLIVLAVMGISMGAVGELRKENTKLIQRNLDIIESNERAIEFNTQSIRTQRAINKLLTDSVFGYESIRSSLDDEVGEKHE